MIKYIGDYELSFLLLRGSYIYGKEDTKCTLLCLNGIESTIMGDIYI